VKILLTEAELCDAMTEWYKRHTYQLDGEVYYIEPVLDGYAALHLRLPFPPSSEGGGE